MQIKHGNVSTTGNSTRGFSNTPKDTQREGGASSHQVGPASPTLALAGPLLQGLVPPFQKLPPPPLVKSVCSDDARDSHQTINTWADPSQIDTSLFIKASSHQASSPFKFIKSLLVHSSSQLDQKYRRYSSNRSLGR